MNKHSPSMLFISVRFFFQKKNILFSFLFFLENLKDITFRPDDFVLPVPFEYPT